MGHTHDLDALQKEIILLMIKYYSFWLLISLVMISLLSSCGEPRRYGDIGGVDITVTVEVDRAFFKNMENRQGRPSAGAGVGFSSGGGSGVGIGVGLSFSSTQVYLVGGDAIGQSNVFRKELKWGSNTFVVPLTPGRVLHLTAIVEGGRRGWEALGVVTIPADSPTFQVALLADGAKITVANQVPATTPPPATPTSPAAP